MRCRDGSALLSRWALIGVGLCLLVGTDAGARGDGSPPEAAPFVCAQVVLAIDGSKSTREDASRRQIEGLRAAFEDESLYRAIQDCLPGSVAFAAMTWSGADQQDLCLPWSLVTNRDDGQRLADRVQGCRYFGGSTDIGRAVDYSLRTLAGSPFQSYYRIIFLLTNGRTDRGAGEALAAARARAAAAAVTLAGYALLRPEPSETSFRAVRAAMPLERYLAERVSTGPRTLTAHARPGDDAEALLRALVELLRQEAG